MTTLICNFRNSSPVLRAVRASSAGPSCGNIAHKSSVPAPSGKLLAQGFGDLDERLPGRLFGADTTTGTPRSPPSRISVKDGTSPKERDVLPLRLRLPAAVAEDLHALAGRAW